MARALEASNRVDGGFGRHLGAGHRYVQQMLSGFVMGEPWQGIGYAGYDNLAKAYVPC